ncbi:hypothetical protein BDZ89DRAFT_1114929 [Hymenopellis radicata]|nr:hypothetical protein BDZ89DRAFT_1114929 [Hymenopellis radicata]
MNRTPCAQSLHLPGRPRKGLTRLEQKYAPDEEFEEMSSKARVFRVYGDEAGKHDLEIVAFFSTVVTTFVISTCQSPRLDNRLPWSPCFPRKVGPS